jgi:hypothetical protein
MLAYALIMGGSQAMSAIGGSISNRKNAEKQQQMTREQLALEESGMDPFRAANSQRRAMAVTDRQLGTSPRGETMGPNGFSRLSGGDYTMSPEMTQFLTELRGRIATGQAQNTGITPGYRSSVQDMTRPFQNGGGSRVPAVGETPRGPMYGHPMLGQPGTQVVDGKIVLSDPTRTKFDKQGRVVPI